MTHSFEAHSNRAPEAILSRLGNPDTVVTFYRGTAKLEKQLARFFVATRGRVPNRSELEALLRVLQGSLGEDRTVYRPIRDRLQQALVENTPLSSAQIESLKEDLLSAYRSTGLHPRNGSAVFITPSRVKASGFIRNLDGTIVRYSLRISDLQALARTEQIYVGIEDGSVEIAAIDDASIRKLFEAMDPER